MADAVIETVGHYAAREHCPLLRCSCLGKDEPPEPQMSVMLSHWRNYLRTVPTWFSNRREEMTAKPSRVRATAVSQTAALVSPSRCPISRNPEPLPEWRRPSSRCMVA